MGYAKWFIFTFLYMTIINLVSRDLNLVSTEYTFEGLKLETDPSLAESLVYVIKIFIDNIKTMLQFLTLQADLPDILNLLFVSPVIVGTGIIILLIIRGS